MHSLLAPILAQLLTVGVGARTEARDVIELRGVQHLEGSAAAGVGLSLSFPFLSLSVGYAPGITVVPLESTPRDVIITDTLFANASTGYTFRFKRALLTLNQAAAYTVQNPVLQALYGPPPADPTFTPLGEANPNPEEAAAVNARRAQDYRVQSWNLRSSARFERALSRMTTFTSDAGYSLGAGLGRARADNPLVQGPDAGLGVRYEITRRDALTTSLVGQYRWSETHNHGQVVTLGELWDHDFSRHTQSQLGAGVAYSREWTGNSATLNSLYPTGTAGFSYRTRIARGLFTFHVGATAAPVLDVTTAAVDPRLGMGMAVSWTRRRLTLTASISSAISLDNEPNSPGALNTLSASAVAAYDLGAGFSVDGGVRSAWQRFEGVTVVNPQSAIFVALNWGASTTLIEPSRRAPAVGATPRFGGAPR